MSRWKEDVAYAHPDVTDIGGEETITKITPPVVQRALPKGNRSQREQEGLLPYIKSPPPKMYSSKAN